MKSEISATASGWLSLTPRSSRRRATIAAMAINSLSFSRGVSCMAPLSVQPQPRQRRSIERGEHGNEIATQRGAVVCNQPHHDESIPGGYADFAHKMVLHGADDGGIGVIAGIFDHARHGHAAACDGALREALRNVAIETQRFGEHQRAVDA